ncbi:hypothetical protein OL239_02615 [Arthrobacter sp. ATA002]|uniref:hypothetical protein n=1 Tax=Arthrobacter sp. ATA002 TaxID=2991715 RepID=UPI0022A76C9A|nr:hypothetical protein [Arthrobacter sp. ATA002]WAP52218.1 hypothetical protein OL239_02615 [Arthrobacter sp. ATA002]
MLKRLAKKAAVAALIFTAFAAGLVAVLGYGAFQMLGWIMSESSDMMDGSDGFSGFDDDGPSLLSFFGVFITPSLFIGAAVLLGLGIRSVRRRARRAQARRGDAAAQAESWRRLYARRDDLLVKWSRYETDVSLMIDYPVMTDYSDPVIRDVIVAMQGIRAAEAEALDLGRGHAEASRLGRAVDRFEVAFVTAEKYARRCGQSKLSDAERSKLATARQALNIILDGAATPSEVDAAYRSLRGSLRGIIDLPDQAVAGLEEHTRQSLGVHPHGAHQRRPAAADRAA